jgi:hypothetical protein
MIMMGSRALKLHPSAPFTPNGRTLSLLLPPIALVGSHSGKSSFQAVIGWLAFGLFTLACYPEEQSVFSANFSGSKRFCRSHISHMLSKILRWVFKRACRTLPVRCRLWW